MHRSRLDRILVAAVLAAIPLACRPAGDETPAGEDSGSVAVTVWTDRTELFFEYPQLVAGADPAPWAVHVTRLSDFSPVTEGRLVVELSPEGGGRTLIFAAESPARAGIFLPEPALPTPGVYAATIRVEGPHLADTVRAGNVTVHASPGDVPPPGEDGGGITFLKEQQWPIEFAVAVAETLAVARTVPVQGTLLAVPGRTAEVAAPVSGLLLAEPNRNAPVPGQAVRAGQAMAVIAPAPGDASFAEAKARVERLRRETARLERLVAAEAVPEIRLSEARHALDVAETELAVLGGGETEGYEYVARAPIDGTVTERAMTLGGHVDAGNLLFRIVDASVLQLRLHLPATAAADAAALRRVEFTVEQGGEIFRTEGVASIGLALDPDTRTLPVILSVVNRDSRLKIGMFAEGRAFVGGETVGLTVPSTAVQFEDGRPVAYVQTGGESFERRTLRLGATDGVRTLVLSGVAAGEHVVTRGAYQVYLGSLNTSELGEGHVH